MLLVDKMMVGNKMSWCIVYLASPAARHIGCEPFCSKLDILRASMRIARSIFPTKDIYVYHEDFTQKKFDYLPPATFIQIDFKGHEDKYNPATGRNYGYLMMCRFFSGVLQSRPELQQYTHYMRLDDDSYFVSPLITGAGVDEMISHDYVYRSLFNEGQSQQGLFDFTVKFMQDRGLVVNMAGLESSGFTRNGKYTGIAPYNNFHVSSLALWKRPLVREYVEELEKSNSILRHGWLDANIHAMIAGVLVPCAVHVGNFGYHHNKHLSVLNSTAIYWNDSLPFHP